MAFKSGNNEVVGVDGAIYVDRFRIQGPTSLKTSKNGLDSSFQDINYLGTDAAYYLNQYAAPGGYLPSYDDRFSNFVNYIEKFPFSSQSTINELPEYNGWRENRSNHSSDTHAFTAGGLYHNGPASYITYNPTDNIDSWDPATTPGPYLTARDRNADQITELHKITKFSYSNRTSFEDVGSLAAPGGGYGYLPGANVGWQMPLGSIGYSTQTHGYHWSGETVLILNPSPFTDKSQWTFNDNPDYQKQDILRFPFAISSATATVTGNATREFSTRGQLGIQSEDSGYWVGSSFDTPTTPGLNFAANKLYKFPFSSSTPVSSIGTFPRVTRTYSYPFSNYGSPSSPYGPHLYDFGWSLSSQTHGYVSAFGGYVQKYPFAVPEAPSIPLSAEYWGIQTNGRVHSPQGLEGWIQSGPEPVPATNAVRSQYPNPFPEILAAENTLTNSMFATNSHKTWQSTEQGFVDSYGRRTGYMNPVAVPAPTYSAYEHNFNNFDGRTTVGFTFSNEVDFAIISVPLDPSAAPNAIRRSCDYSSVD